MTLKIFNTLKRKKELFKPIKENSVGLYTCGPTVYNFAHIGNFRSYIFGDLLKRYLKYKGFKVKHIMNLTDVDDKTIAGSQKEGISQKEFTERYSKLFFEDLNTLNIEPADVYPKATEHVKQMIEIIKKLQKHKIAYEASDGIYFAIKNHKGYGKLAQIDKTQLIEGKRVLKDEYDKESVQDFALWKYWDEADGDVFWDDGIKKGRPGWHIECSAMSTKYLGQPFDIHTGGVDLIFPHHENEIAQSEGAEGKKFVNYWMHCVHLVVDGKKMSKSLGNFYTLRDVLEKGYNAAAVRYLLLATHYRAQLNFTFDELKATTKTVESIIDFARRLEEADGEEKTDVEKFIARHTANFEKAMDDDLNMSQALAAVFGLISDANKLLAENKLSKKQAQKVLTALKNFDKILGILHYRDDELEREVEELIKKREEARNSKNWKESDRIRDVLKQKNIILEDTKSGVRWRKLL